MTSESRQGATVIACLFLVLFLGVADSQVISPLLPGIRSQFSKTSAELGLLFTGYSLAAGISVLFWGPLSDLFGCRNGLLAGLLIFGVGASICWLSPDFRVLLLGRVVTGMGASMLSLNSISYAAGFFPYRSRGWAMGSIVSSYFAALILGVPVGSWAGDRLGWHAVFGLAVVLSVILVVLVYIFLRPLGSPVREEAGRGMSLFSSQAKAYGRFLRGKETAGGLSASFFASGGAMGFLAFLGVWLHDAFGVSGRQIGLVFLASGCAALLASPIAGAVSDRIGKRLQFILSSGAFAFLLLALPRLRWGALLFVVFGAVSMAAAFRQGPMEALVTELVPPESRGSYIALRNAFSQLGIALAASLSGVLFENRGYAAVCALGCFANLAAAGLMMIAVRRRDL
jgi:predicted MFS family arabinose efflux permease